MDYSLEMVPHSLPIVKFSDLIGAISDEYQPSLKIVDSRVINNDIHVWSRDLSDEICFIETGAEDKINKRNHSTHSILPKKSIRKGHRTGPLVWNMKSITSRPISSSLLPRPLYRRPIEKYSVSKISNPHSGPFISDRQFRNKFMQRLYKEENVKEFNPVIWKHWEDSLLWEENNAANCISYPSDTYSPMLRTPSGSMGLLYPSSSTGMLMPTSIPTISITSPQRSLSPGIARLKESSTTLLQEEPINSNDQSTGFPLISSNTPNLPSPLVEKPPNLIISSDSTTTYPYLFGNDSTFINSPSPSSIGNISDHGNIGLSMPTAISYVKRICSKILNNQLISSNWEAFISWDEENTGKDSFHTFFQPALSEMDPSLILERIDVADKNSSVISNTSKGKIFAHLSTQELKQKEQEPSYLKGLDPSKAQLSLALKQKHIPRSLSFSIILDRFNVSGDKYYHSKDPKYGFSSNDGMGIQANYGTGYSSSITLAHSIPALKLARPFYKAWMTKSELRAFHRSPFGAKYAPRIVFKKTDKLISPFLNEISEGIDSLPHSIHATAIIPRSIKDLTLVPGSGALLTPAIILVEYSEEFPVVIQKEGMGSLIYRYTRESASKTGNPIEEGSIGIPVTLSRGDPSPFLGFGDVRPGQSVFALQNNLFRTPLFKHNLCESDFLLVRQWLDGVVQPAILLEVPEIYVAGQILPMTEVFGPQSRKANIYCKNRVEVAAYRQYQRPGNLSRRAKISKICRAFPQFQEGVLRKWLKDTSDFLRVGRDTGWWILKKGAPSLSEDEIRALMTPELVCIYESMLAGKQRLLDAGLGHLADSSEEASADDESGTSLNIEIKLAPWNVTRNFILATQGKALVELLGSGDPTGCGEGFSFNRIPLKSTFHRRWAAGSNRIVLSSDASDDIINAKYSIAEQQQAYREQIMRIWDAQYASLSNPKPLIQYKGIDLEQVTKSLSFEEENHEEVPEDDSISISSSASSFKEKGNLTSSVIPPFPKQLIIRRRVLADDGITIIYQTDIIKDSRIIIEYLEQKCFEEVSLRKRRTKIGGNLSSFNGGGTLSYSSSHNNNLDQIDETESSSGTVAKKLKCGNCGMYGHMKTNRSCPMYSSSQQSSTGHDLNADENNDENRSQSSCVVEESAKAKMLVRRTAISELCKLFSKIVAEITSVPNSWPFHLPVQEKIAPGYHSIIKTPMDFSTLRKNINNRKYLSADQFLSDVRLIYSNCASYNGAEHPFSMIAFNVVKMVEEMIQEHSSIFQAIESKVSEYSGQENR